MLNRCIGFCMAAILLVVLAGCNKVSQEAFDKAQKNAAEVEKKANQATGAINEINGTLAELKKDFAEIKKKLDEKGSSSPPTPPPSPVKAMAEDLKLIAGALKEIADYGKNLYKDAYKDARKDAADEKKKETPSLDKEKPADEAMSGESYLSVRIADLERQRDSAIAKLTAKWKADFVVRHGTLVFHEKTLKSVCNPGYKAGNKRQQIDGYNYTQLHADGSWTVMREKGLVELIAEKKAEINELWTEFRGEVKVTEARYNSQIAALQKQKTGSYFASAKR